MIFTDTYIQLKFIEIISNRVESRCPELEDSMPSSISETIVNEFKVSPALAHALAWGEECNPTEEEIEILADGLELQEDLLRILFRKNSNEIIKHTLDTVAKNFLDGDECHGCHQLEMAILETDLDLYTYNELYNLVLDSLDHIIIRSVESDDYMADPAEFLYDEIADESAAEDLHEWFDDDAEEKEKEDTSSELSPAMLAAFEKLNQSQQLDLLALAYQKLQTTETDNRELSKIEVIASLRNSYLSELACEVFDVLANGPKIGAATEDLIAKIRGANKRSIGQLTRSVNHAVDKLNEDNPHANFANPLKTLKRGKTKHYLLDPDVIDSWKAVQQASSLKTSFDPTRV